MSWIIARLGGWNCHYRPSGPKTMRDGWQRFSAIAEGFALNEAEMCESRRPESLGEGVTPEQLLIVLDQLLRDAAQATYAPGLRQAHSHVAVALRAEARRLGAVRG